LLWVYLKEDIAVCVLCLVADLRLSHSSNVLVICAVSYLLLYDMVCCLFAVSSNITCKICFLCMWWFLLWWLYFLWRIVLYCIVLCCMVFYCIVLYCVVSYCIACQTLDRTLTKHSPSRMYTIHHYFNHVQYKYTKSFVVFVICHQPWIYR